MPGPVYRYAIAARRRRSVERALVLSLNAVEALRGESAARLDARYFLDRPARRLVIDASTALGRDFNKLFAGFMASLAGPDSFRVERVVGRRPA
jgi:hypothetical protein